MKKLTILLLLFGYYYSAEAQVLDSLAADTLQPDSVQLPRQDTIPPDTILQDSIPAGIPQDSILPEGNTGLAPGRTDTIPDTIEVAPGAIRGVRGINIRDENIRVQPGFMRVDTTYTRVPALMPLPFEGDTELAYEEEHPLTTPELKLEAKKPVWLYPQYFWRKGLITGFNFSQASFTNWASGGENNLNLITFASIYFNRSTLRYTWENLIDAAYGVQSFQGLDVIRKSEDRLEFTSKIGHKTSETLFTSFLLNFKSQFDVGYRYPNDDSEPTKISTFLAPAYITTSLGLDYKPSKVFSLLLSPISGKITLVMDQELADKGSFGVEAAVLDTAGRVVVPGKNSRTQLGMGLNARLNTPLGKNITMQSKLDLFGDYEKPTAIDISWDNAFVFRVNNAISANLSTSLIYDEDILIRKDGETVGKPRVQFKEIFSLGVRFDI